MIWNNPYNQNNNGTNNTSYPQRVLNKKFVLIFIIFIISSAIIATFIVRKNELNSSEYKAKMAARKEIPNAEAKQVTVADGFAIAIVYVPKDKTQLGAGNTSIFKVNEDGTMTYITSGSYFSSIDLLKLGIPLKTQAKLNKKSLDDIKFELTQSCNYNYNDTDTAGLSGFDGSFDPDGWQIDSASFNGIKQALDSFMKAYNANKEYDNKIVCINAETKGSSVDVNKTSFVSTFKFKLKFITGNGDLTDHGFTFTDGSIYSRIYTLDGKQISSQ